MIGAVRFRFIRLVLLLALVAIFGAACQRDTSPPQESAEPGPGGSITIGLEAETNGWLPGTGAFANAGTFVAQTFYDPLMLGDSEGVLRPYLAESVASNDALTEWTVKLRSGIKFHDGTDLTADVMKQIFDGYLRAPGSNVAGSVADVDHIEVIDTSTYKYVLKQANAAFSDLLDGAIGWPFSVEAAKKYGKDAGSHPVGTGPFIFDSWTRDDRLIVKKNPSYWQKDRPYLDQVIFRPIPDEDTRLASLLSGDIDAMQTLRQSIVRQARDAAKKGDIKIYEHIGNNGGGAIFNTLVPPVDDVRVRKGLAYAIDQGKLVDVLGGKDITPLQTQWFSPNSPWYSKDAESKWPNYDTDKAKQLLSQYVNDPKRSDGKAVGSPIAVDFNCPPDPSLIELSQAYQSYWSAVGVQVKLVQVEQAAHIQNAIGSPTESPAFKGSFMINCWRMGGGDDPYITLVNAFGPPSRQPLNFTNYTNAKVQEQLEILRTSRDEQARYKAVETIMVLFADEVPNLWTGATASMVGTKLSLRDLDKWTFPDGGKGGGMQGGVSLLGQVWIAQ